MDSVRIFGDLYRGIKSSSLPAVPACLKAPRNMAATVSAGFGAFCFGRAIYLLLPSSVQVSTFVADVAKNALLHETVGGMSRFAVGSCVLYNGFPLLKRALTCAWCRRKVCNAVDQARQLMAESSKYKGKAAMAILKPVSDTLEHLEVEAKGLASRTVLTARNVFNWSVYAGVTALTLSPLGWLAAAGAGTGMAVIHLGSFLVERYLDKANAELLEYVDTGVCEAIERCEQDDDQQEENTTLTVKNEKLAEEIAQKEKALAQLEVITQNQETNASNLRRNIAKAHSIATEAQRKERVQREKVSRLLKEIRIQKTTASRQQGGTVKVSEQIQKMQAAVRFCDAENEQMLGALKGFKREIEQLENALQKAIQQLESLQQKFTKAQEDTKGFRHAWANAVLKELFGSVTHRKRLENLNAKVGNLQNRIKTLVEGSTGVKPQLLKQMSV